ncbi:MAG: AAA family ATPase [Burkholderiales bacterium]
MYLAHFGLQHLPFDSANEPKQLVFPGARHETARSLLHLIARETGFIRIIGEPGTGKTTLCRWLLRKLPPERYRVVHVTDPSLSPRLIDVMLAEKLGMTVHRTDPRRMRADLRDRLNHSAISGEKLIVLIDEAQSMPLETLEHLRLLGQGVGRGGNALRLVLVGPPELEKRLTHEAFGALNDRIAHDLRLNRLSRDEVHEYLHGRLRNAGYDGPRIFSVGAVRAVAVLSRGLPERINLLADKALMAASLAHAFEVHTRDVQVAARELRLSHPVPRRRLRLFSLPLGAGFAAGVTSALAAVALALHFGWMGASKYEPRSSLGGSPYSQALR